MRKILSSSLRVGLLLCLPALIAWLTGQPFIFPSLGPSAFSLAVGEQGEATCRRVLGGHLVGVAAGLATYHLIAQGLTLASLPPGLSFSLLRLAASGVISVVLATAGMLAAKARHPPACATTLIVSLGLLATFRAAVIIMLAVAVMYSVHRFLPPNRQATVQGKE